ncbi:BN860_05578g1_1 [Zygosaccharomyces bailii CLIB 213]|uniref:tRNA pseudouridine synthase 1 n=1 Tax=Zygosaccharomyces bailii (strain CLIB 213 / ATCC 58445 / CBS 680 / BCRC 21525 / NBRC 1098 / NCYC 1416 / NRRL Y-2227) TaxID=1333698 RepID=A0A8J2T4U7_ZYGB2|nr:BN860_05578g1_1 [Zygosaccharomyces bailii CLIB 213]
MSQDSLKPVYDDQVNEEAYKRGSQYKWTKARKADYERDGSHDQAPPEKRVKYETTPLTDEHGKPVEKEPRLPKRKVAVMIGYCGTGYHGMQYNPPNPTIEAELFKAFVDAGAISKANSNDLKKNGFMRAARTDKGVHAGGNLISLKMIIEDPQILKKINENLPETIRVWDIKRVNKAFDCRKMCSSRWYEYLLPTYSLIGPKPGSALYKTLEDGRTKLPGMLDDDQESKEFWAGVEEEASKMFDEKELSAIRSYIPPPRDEFTGTEDLYLKVKKYKQLENVHRRRYRISQEKLQKFRSTMEQYLGAHNFHNFTLGKDFKESSSIRYMKEIKVSEPFVIGEAETEWVSIKIHGQSFMLHQIRKMISMATLIARCGCPVERISQAYGAQKLNIPKAPALGLLLESPVFEGYNTRLEKFGYKPIEFVNYQDEMDRFKLKHIYDKIYKEEVDENVFNAFFSYIDNFDKVTGAKGEETVDKVGTSVQKSVFEFLSAEGIHPTEVTKETEKNAILSSNSLLNNSQDMSNESAQKEDNKESSSL